MDTTVNSIKRIEGKITVDKVEPHTFKKNRLQAQIRQVSTVDYPSGRIGSDLNDPLFTEAQFNFGPGQRFEDTRVTWIDVPIFKSFVNIETSENISDIAYSQLPEDKKAGFVGNERYTEVEVLATLANFPKGRLRRILSLRPILTDAHRAAIASGITTEDVIAQKQIVKYPDDAKDAAGNSIAGMPIMYGGRIQYKYIGYSKEGLEDDDRRIAEINVKQETPVTTNIAEAVKATA